MNRLVAFDQPYEVAILSNYKKDCSYCGIDFINKPTNVDLKHDGFRLSCNISWDTPILSESDYRDIYIAVVGPNPNTRILEVFIFKVSDMCCEWSCLDNRYIYHCQAITATPRIINMITAVYTRKFVSDFESMLGCKQLTANEKCDPVVFNKTESVVNVKDTIRNIVKSINDGEIMIKNIPVITHVIINDPAVIVFWSDTTKTIGKCMDNDVFNPEIGLSMAISRKYFETLGFPNPRAAFKSQLKHAEDRSAKTKERRNRKMKLLKPAEDSAND